MALIRPAVLAALVYLGYTVAFPDYTGTVYHVIMSALRRGVEPLAVSRATGVDLWFLHKLLDLSKGAFKIALEVAFLASVALFVGCTMPQKSGKSPLTQWSEGARPTQSSARRGLERLGLDPNGSVAAKLVGLFPKR